MKTLEQRMLVLAQADVGKGEVGGNNRGGHVESVLRAVGRANAIKARPPWCGAQAGAWGQRAGAIIPPPPDALLANSYIVVGRKLLKNELPYPGIWAIMPRTSNPAFGHITVVESVDAGAGTFVGIGGNQAKRGEPDQVCRQTFRIKSARAFVAPKPVTVKAPIDPKHVAEYADRWKSMEPLEANAAHIDATARRLIELKSRYRAVSVKTGVPWVFIGLLHYRESTFDFNTHLHNGDSLSAPTVRVPAGRPFGRGPFTWEESAIDALKLKKLDKVLAWTIEEIAYRAEQYNGRGYRNRGVPSEYLWGMTSIHKSGKFVRDHVYDPKAKSKQAGVMPILRRVAELDPSFSLTSELDAKSVIETISSSGSLKSMAAAFVSTAVAAVCSAASWIWETSASLFYEVPDTTDQIAPLVGQGQQVAGWLSINPTSVALLILLVVLARVAYRRFIVERTTNV